jgi:sulfate permease, SulP family
LFGGLLCYGLVGTSSFAVVSATSLSAAVLLAATHAISEGNEALRMALADGLILFMGLFFVVGGFALGLAVTIVIRQMPKIVGAHPANGDIVHFVTGFASSAGRWNLAGLALAPALTALGLLKILANWRSFYYAG